MTIQIKIKLINHGYLVSEVAKFDGNNVQLQIKSTSSTRRLFPHRLAK